LLTRQVKNVLIKAIKQKDINGLFGTKSRSKIFSMSHQKKILGIHDINRISYDYIKALHFEKKWKSTCQRKRRNKAVLQRKNVLENILVKLQIWIRMLSFKHSQLQLMHVGCLKWLGRRECSSEHSSLGTTHFLQHLCIKQQKARAHGLFLIHA
jgi:hypothetical protein